ncbi:MAG: DinB family protein [Candidatus Korobacteraceae bacterium]
MKPIAIAVLLLFALAPVSIAQDKDKGAASATANPIVATVRQMEQRYAKNLIGAAEEMPAAKYSYKPTPEQITFAHLVMHIATSNDGLCAAIAGEPARETKLSETDAKEVLTKALQDSFTYCEQVLAKADDSTLGQPAVLFGGRTSTRGAAMVHLAADWADHYSAAAMYLRLNGLLPPSAQKAMAK